MNKNLRFSHKILLAAALIVIAAFASFTLYNDWLQRNAIRDDLNNYLNEMGEVTADNIQTWLNGRILLVENAAQNIAINPEPANVASLLEQKSLTSTFMATYLGDATELRGAIGKPVVLRYNHDDPTIPLRWQSVYPALAATAGHADKVTVLPPAGEGHCGFSPGQVDEAFDVLTARPPR